jgi:hypothetical protein
MTSSKLVFAGVVHKHRNKEESVASGLDLVQIEDAINLTLNKSHTFYTPESGLNFYLKSGLSALKSRIVPP